MNQFNAFKKQSFKGNDIEIHEIQSKRNTVVFFKRLHSLMNRNNL